MTSSQEGLRWIQSQEWPLVGNLRRALDQSNSQGLRDSTSKEPDGKSREARDCNSQRDEWHHSGLVVGPKWLVMGNLRRGS
ncbi:hypothetical protein AVEN_12499-1 [Araneus ventricosus]|uniref:Uncharacterized protein n=1 Tax=Araneus ventricosus TaxID=182803 RepID=A0A4Y2LDN5_ARAVE|nr:hypothetical protein AVEN_12499-1 [Araneus ventricosus]